MSRFVVLRHECPSTYKPGVHWDFMLERAGTLRTWALAEPPELGRAIAAEPLTDHRLAYLDYEGPISGNRGIVRRWDAGTYEMLGEAPERLTIRLQGVLLQGLVELTADPSGRGRWLFCWVSH
jgi:hypothetical protein